MQIPHLGISGHQSIAQSHEKQRISRIKDSKLLPNDLFEESLNFECPNGQFDAIPLCYSIRKWKWDSNPHDCVVILTRLNYPDCSGVGIEPTTNN
ncbi:hypothetical protein QE382_002676 [Sphingobacterium zeae]|uniref:Uncharacterized protein n=1 Tax=Sphingobacterium zeae TaxID=1776859 RepID=A0ABU0U6V8_9SPHI|nr:hypothetical protein [Sphingobacterium zeae]MDQ1150692.1 hypothetical protein [Sphingobacterium zeae]